MNIKDYRYILSIGDLGSISRAAEHLYITQSALTRFLQRVEADVGTPLFYRQSKALHLTAAGTLYLERAREIVRLDYEMGDEIKQMITDAHAHLRVGFTVGRAGHVLGSMLPAFFEKLPQVRVTTVFHMMTELLDMLEHKRLDLVFGGSGLKSPQYKYTALGKTHFVLVVQAGSEIARRGRVLEGFPYPVVGRESWEDERFIVPYTGTNSQRLLSDLLQKEGISPQIRLQLPDVNSCMAAVEQGLGISMLWSTPKNDAKIEYLCMREFGLLEQEYYAVMRKDVVPTPPMKRMIEAFSQK